MLSASVQAANRAAGKDARAIGDFADRARPRRLRA
jgi:hypothetical protein